MSLKASEGVAKSRFPEKKLKMGKKKSAITMGAGRNVCGASETKAFSTMSVSTEGAHASSTTALATTLLRPADTAPVGPVAPSSLGAIQAGRESLDNKWDEFRNAFTEMQRLAATRFLGLNGAVCDTKRGPQSHSVYLPAARPIVEGGSESERILARLNRAPPHVTAEATQVRRNGPAHEKWAAKHPKASREGGSAMGEWKDVVAGLRKQQRMDEDKAANQIRPIREGRAAKFLVARKAITGRGGGSACDSSSAADPKPALAYDGAFARISFEQRCECCRLATTEEIARDFAPLPKIKPGDWLYSQEEKGQTLSAFMRRTRGMNAKPGPARSTLYVQPLGSINLDKIAAAENFQERQSRVRRPQAEKGVKNLDLMLPGSRFHQLLESFLQAFYLGMKVKMLPYKQIDLKTVGSRGRGDDWQLNASDLLYKQLPRFSGQARAYDGYAFVGVTMEDLYPSDDWGFVFGLADPLGRTGVFSFSRYADGGLENAKMAEARLLKRAVKVMAHEIGHTLGMLHCIHFSCLMQGSMSAEESDTKPHEFCPVCLRKLFFQIEFDPLLRYEALIKWIEALDGDSALFAGDAIANEVVFGDWKAWYQRRIDAILGTGGMRVEA